MVEASPAPKNYLTNSQFFSWAACSIIIQGWAYLKYFAMERHGHDTISPWIMLAIVLACLSIIYAKTPPKPSAIVRFVAICVAIIATYHFMVGQEYFGPTWKKVLAMNIISYFFLLFSLGWDIALALDYLAGGFRVDWDTIRVESEEYSKTTNTNNTASGETVGENLRTSTTVDRSKRDTPIVFFGSMLAGMAFIS